MGDTIMVKVRLQKTDLTSYGTTKRTAAVTDTLEEILFGVVAKACEENLVCTADVGGLRYTKIVHNFYYNPSRVPQFSPTKVEEGDRKYCFFTNGGSEELEYETGKFVKGFHGILASEDRKDRWICNLIVKLNSRKTNPKFADFDTETFILEDSFYKLEMFGWFEPNQTADEDLGELK